MDPAAPRAARAGPAPWVRSLRASDVAGVGALNDAAAPAVNAVPPAFHEHWAAQGFCSLVAMDAPDAGGAQGLQPAGLLGFLLAMHQDADYDSDNFQWFKARYPRFVYVDRAVVAPAARRRGVGQALYRALFSRCGRMHPLVACEVNLDPPNPVSLAFHQHLGFQPAGEQLTAAGTRVCLLTRRG